jgi:hypothetical protein
MKVGKGGFRSLRPGMGRIGGLGARDQGGLEGVRLGEACTVEAVREVLVLPSVDLVLEGKLEEVEGSEPGLRGVGGRLSTALLGWIKLVRTSGPCS